MACNYDYRKLRGRIKEKFGTQSEFSKKLGLSEVSVSNPQFLFSSAGYSVSYFRQIVPDHCLFCFPDILSGTCWFTVFDAFPSSALLIRNSSRSTSQLLSTTCRSVSWITLHPVNVICSTSFSSRSCTSSRISCILRNTSIIFASIRCSFFAFSIATGVLN